MSTIIIHGYLNDKFKKLWNIVRSAKKSLWMSHKSMTGARAVALDIQKRKLFYLKTTSGSSSCLIVDLNNLEKCTLKKEYSNIDAGQLKVNKLHLFLKKILLNLKLKNSTGIVTLTLYDAHEDGPANAPEAEASAHKWEVIVSQLKPVAIKERA